MNRPLRFLVCDAYPAEVRSGLEGVGAALAGTLYQRLLHRLEPHAIVDILAVSDAEGALPRGTSLADYDAVVWTGSSLTVYHADDPCVRRNLDFARQVRDCRIPSFGSCWAAQLSVTVAGGRCAASPKGREFGISRSIALNDVGREHPLFRGKPAVFDTFTSHADEIVELPPGAELLASNGFSRVQAVSLGDSRGFWGVQYHPEYELVDVARLGVFRMDELVRQGMFPDRRQGMAWVAQLEALHADPERADLQTALGVGPELLDPRLRTLEARNWIDFAVKPNVAA